MSDSRCIVAQSYCRVPASVTVTPDCVGYSSYLPYIPLYGDVDCGLMIVRVWSWARWIDTWITPQTREMRYEGDEDVRGEAVIL